MKKKIAFFTTGWCCEILSQFISGMQKAFGSEGADIFLFCILEQLLTPKEVERLVNNAKVIAESKNGGKVTQDDIADVLDGVIDVADIQERVAKGEVDISALKNELPNLLGEEKSEELLKKTDKLVKKMAKDSK